MADRKLRQRIAQACRILARLNLTGAVTGHVSARAPSGDRILIRARGPGELGVRYTTDEQIIEVGLDGKLLKAEDPTLAVPIEVYIHLAVFRARPDVQSVIHIHPHLPVLFTICDKPLLPLYGAFDPPSLMFALDGVPLYPRSVLISDDPLGDDLARAMGSSPVCLMRGHGITAAGATVEEATLNAIGLCDLAKMNYEAYLLGDPRPISAEDQAEFRRIEERLAKNAGSRNRTLWNYYVELVDE